MYELTQLGSRSWYIESPAKIGVIDLGDGSAALIDSGNDKDAGKKVKKILDAQGWRLAAVYNTHAHADHIGGNQYLQKQTGCRVYAPGIEQSFTCHPVLEPAFLYGGNPPQDLRHKFLMAHSSDASPLTPDTLPEGMTLLPLPGHAFDMAGFRTADDVVYLADCLSSLETLEKYQVSFLTDVAAYLDTLARVKAMEARWFVPSHAAVTEDIAPLAQANIDKVLEIGGRMTEICRTPRSFEEILREIFSAYGLQMTFQQHALVGSTIRSYLTWLTASGVLAAAIDDNRLVWQRA